jgi:hypothetical protein
LVQIFGPCFVELDQILGAVFISHFLLVEGLDYKGQGGALSHVSRVALDLHGSQHRIPVVSTNELLAIGDADRCIQQISELIALLTSPTQEMLDGPFLAGAVSLSYDLNAPVRVISAVCHLIRAICKLSDEMAEGLLATGYMNAMLFLFTNRPTTSLLAILFDGLKVLLRNNSNTVNMGM